ncbi:DUF3040 domain-containing protein [Actinokineospora guangxiensis]|uniref:DUF3040 domain-containing protein n=1 Tax=Actinokineospora guangxiensis TaxID=1490288 RepID=A0ABW0EVI9_9PSEU
MDFRGLSRREQRQLEAIEQHLDNDAPEVVSAFRAAADPSGAPSGQGLYLLLSAFLAAAGLLTGVQGLVIVSMTLGMLSPILPDPLQPGIGHRPPPEDTSSGHVPSA